MPAGDGTGPMGAGSLTGRGAGFCAGFGVPGFVNPSRGRGGRFGFGRGWGRGFGRGRGWGRGWFAGDSVNVMQGLESTGYWPAAVAPATSSPGQEAAALKAQVAQMESMLQHMRQRITELEPNASEET